MRLSSRPLSAACTALSAALVGLVLAAPAGSASTDTPPADVRWSSTAAVRSLSAAATADRRAALEAAAPARTSTAATYRGVQSLKACYGVERPSGVDGTPYDAATYGAYHGCISDGSWLFAIVTHAPFVAADLDAIDFFADTDGDAATGCGGFEYDVFGFWSTQSQQLLAGVFATPDCTNSTLLQNADLQAPSTKDVGLQFSHAAIGGGSSVRWFGGVSSRSESVYEFVPSSGFHTETGFGGGGTPGPTPTGADGCPTSTNSWYAATSDAGAVRDLRAAGLDDVRRLRGGLVAFTGDKRDAEQALDVPVRRDVVRRLHAVPNDPGTAAQWALPAVRAAEAWELSKGSRDVVVAVLDTGVDATHPDLQGRLLPGYDAITGTALPAGNSDPHGHGTAIAGQIAAATDNGTGLASLGWNTRVLPVRVADAQGSSSGSTLANAVRYAADRGAHVISMSLGSCVADAADADAVRYAQSKGALVVASAGNEFQQGNPVEYPAAYADVLAVGATGRDGTRAFYSNTGSYVDMVAPGGSGNQGADNDMLMLKTGGGTTTAAGTSFSAPLVAAAAALVRAARPDLAGTALGDVLVRTARDTGAPGRDEAFGTGVLDAEAALRAVLPGAPPAGPGAGPGGGAGPGTAPTGTAPTAGASTTAPSATPAGSTPAPGGFGPGTTPTSSAPAPTTAAPLAPATTAPPAPHAAAPSVALRPGRATTGQPVRVEVRTSPGAVVDLYAYSRPSTDYRRVRQGRADSTGLAVFGIAPATHTRLYATATSASGRAVNGGSVGLVVAAKASVSAPARRAKLTYRFSGSVQPARAGAPVTVYSRASNGRLTRLASTRTVSGGRWSVDRRFSRATTLTVVAGVSATDLNSAATSAPRRTAVR